MQNVHRHFTAPQLLSLTVLLGILCLVYASPAKAQICTIGSSPNAPAHVGTSQYAVSVTGSTTYNGDSAATLYLLRSVNGGAYLYDYVEDNPNYTQVFNYTWNVVNQMSSGYVNWKGKASFVYAPGATSTACGPFYTP